MAIKGPVVSFGYEAAADLTGKKFFAVALDGDGKVDVSGAGAKEGIGILQNEPVSGKTASVVTSGHVWARAGNTINAGDFVKSDANGKLITAGSADDFFIGRAQEDAVVDDEFDLEVRPGFRSV